MKTLPLLLTVLLPISCTNDDDFNSRQDSIPQNDIDVGLVACADAQYVPYMDSEYVLPYPVGKTYGVDLSQCTSSYHSEGRPDQFAVDFAMEIGEEVTASRAGSVVYVEQSGTDGGFPNNLVIVKHADGTFAQYMHLTQNGVVVETGQSVGKGTLLGYSGATGLAGYPHLHFVVTKDDYSYPYISIPHNFSNTSNNPKGPISGEVYTALPY